MYNLVIADLIQKPQALKHTLLRGLGWLLPLLLTAWRASVSDSTAESLRRLSALAPVGLMR